MKRNLISVVLMLLVFIFNGMYSYSEELPRPTYDNSLIFSWTYHYVSGSPLEITNIKSQFENGIYAPLCFSDFVGLDMDWHVDINDADSEIQGFKDKLDNRIAFAKLHNTGIHLTLTFGISRNVQFYKAAKQEDIRNCQWYNDNNISSLEQQSGTSALSHESGIDPLFLGLNHVENFSYSQPMANDSAVNKYVFTTFSRYARKLRGHLEAKVSAMFDYLEQQQAANPKVLIIISAPGESELNFYRLNGSPALQNYFCDYSPFTVLEFRDWIKHEGFYADGEKYAGEGYENGGSRYQGSGGLANFNADFGTSFTSWNLKYYNWSLSEPVDTDYTDTVNPAPGIIPISQYTYNGMMPGSGSKYISGGFDAPRVMQDAGTDDFYDLWHTFRELLVYHYVKDMTSIARDSGFPKDQYFTHQIPGDYLFGTRPNDPQIPYLNARYYASASPMWTADVYPDTGLGVTLYDINFGTWFARTTQYGIGAASSMSNNWAALEYNPEVIPSSVSTPISSVGNIYNQMVRLYNGNPHVISFYKWLDSSSSSGNVNTVYQYKNTNRGAAAKQFFDAVADTARQPIGTVFTPKKVEKFTGSYNSLTGVINLSWSAKIWTDLAHYWTNWGDFKEFVLYRGYTEDFTTNKSSEILRQIASGHIDFGFNYGGMVYYKLAAVNTKGEIGPIETIAIEVSEFVPTPILSVSRERLNFGYITGKDAPPTQSFQVTNAGTGALNWTAVDDAEWLSLDPSANIGDAVVTVSVDPTGLAVGTYNATITVSDPLAIDSPQSITVNLTVKSASQDQLPFGSFDSPEDNSTVMSSIAVTGWALDDVGLESVKIYRDPVLNEGKALIYIGEAVFVEGPRPDVEKAYPDYPYNYKAGWGYMMLTNFLPGGGNGTFNIHAIARDTFGKEVTLGNKTIICDNASAVKPFGAIDTPTQGGEAAGSSFINWGWVLTPLPNSINTNGSTINVYVDGVNLGHPKYNNYRKDIATLFPGYANSNGAAGYFIMDTTKLANGLHTIQWTAMNSAGNTDGIGSRYFTIQNSGSSASQESQASTLSAGGSMFNGEISRITRDYSSPISIKKGFKNKASEKIYPTHDGVTVIRIKQLERVEVHFPGEALIASPLPVGSTLDSKAGIFYWSPGPAHLGNYIFDFVVKEGIPGKLKRKQLKIQIVANEN
jgi:hypothetical protein